MFYDQNAISNHRWSDKKPTAHVTVGKQRIKQYEKNVVYLDNKQKFELELFNPKTTKVLAKIKLNGEYISSAGIVIRPGERVFLQRYLDTNNSFVFETYNVDPTDKSAVEAIKRNGDVKVEFYDEYIQQIWYTNTNYNYNNPTLINTFTTSSGRGLMSKTLSSTVDSMSFYNTSLSSEPQMETGTVSKGESTNQSFEYDNSSYNYFATSSVEWKILPKSQQPITSEDLTKKYCHECGTKIKKDSYKFCPICGTKLDI